MNGMELPIIIQYICFIKLNPMLKKAKMVLVVLMLSGICFSALADKGIGKKNKTKITLNINSGNSIRKSISLNLKSGLKYTFALNNADMNVLVYLKSLLEIEYPNVKFTIDDTIKSSGVYKLRGQNPKQFVNEQKYHFEIRGE